MPNPNGGLITENNAQYYSGQQGFLGDGVTKSFSCSFNTDLVSAISGAVNSNFSVKVNAVTVTAYTMSGNIVTFTTAPIANSTVLVTLNSDALMSNYGGYQYISLVDVINNFIVAYVGAGKLIPSVKRTDVIFHAKRGMQEFSYDTLRSVKSQELNISPSLTAIIPQDYVNYIRVSSIDSLGVKRIIYPNNNLTINPNEVNIQDIDGVPIQGGFGENIESAPARTVDRWRGADTSKITGGYTTDQLNDGVDSFENGFDSGYWGGIDGQRYGLEPQYTQVNGFFGIDDRRGVFTFSSNLKGRLVVIEYISDGLSYDLDTRVPKMIEEAMYAHIIHAILSGRVNQPEYVVNRLKKERSAKLRNAKIRLSNIKIEEITQVMRGKSKWIKS